MIEEYSHKQDEDSINILSDLTSFMKYAKYLPELGRREVWNETCNRNQEMHIKHYKKYPSLIKDIVETYGMVRRKEVLPSMRSMQFAGRPIEITPSRIFNCAYLPIDAIEAFSEIMFLLLGGTGVGYSVQLQHVAKLPPINGPLLTQRFVIGDSIEGWADAVKVLISAYFRPDKLYRPIFDFSDIRPKGARLVTSGGKAPGPAPLKACLDTIEDILRKHVNGDQLSSLEVHDIVCIIADAVLAGGIRRAALISLFSLDDGAMLKAKSNFPVIRSKELGMDRYEIVVDEPGYGETTHYLALSAYALDLINTNGTLPWYYFQPQRGRSNNSVTLLRGAVSRERFDQLWDTIQASGCGEPGFYWTNNLDYGSNPCCEVSLKPFCFCNLTTINARKIKTQAQLNRAVKAATFLGTLQAGYTNFHYLRPIWQETTEADALLGVSMTGVAEAGYLTLDFEKAAKIVLEENARVADIIGINHTARGTVLKPEGTSSLVLGTSSGVHAWHHELYVRRMRVKKNEAVYKYLLEQIPQLVEDDLLDPSGAIICIPVKAPEGAITREETALDLLERVLLFSQKWIRPGHVSGDNTHNVSATITIKPNEWSLVGAWMWEHRNDYNGLSVLPYDGGTYTQAPFMDATQEEYELMRQYLKQIDLTQVNEAEDETNLTGELACAGGACTI
jgi:ribonucleoside-diphosphate reductase alpha chain